MSSPTTITEAPRQSFLDKHHLLLRRLHSLTGIVPIGVFLIAHLITNSSILWGKAGLRGERPELGLLEGGAAYFHKEVHWINNEVPHLLLIELTLWAAIAFHTVYGFVIIRSGRFNTARYGYAANFRYALQRVSGYVGIAFILYHVATLRWGMKSLVPGGIEWTHQASASALANVLRGSTDGGVTALGAGVAIFYFVCVSLLVFHFANGLWTAAITWGLTVSESAQRRWGFVCAGLGGGLMLAAWGSIIGFMLLDPGAARKAELPHAHAPAATTPVIAGK